MSDIVIQGGPGLAIIGYNQINSNNQFQIENENSNSTQGSSATKKKGLNGLSAQSSSQADFTKQMENLSNSSLVVAYNSAICDFSILPSRIGTQNAAGSWQATGNNQAQTQVPATAINQDLNVSVSTGAIPPVTTPATTYPNPGSDNVPFSGTESLVSQAANKKGNAQSFGSLAINGFIARENNIGMDGRVALSDAAGNPLDPANPSAAPGYNPATNTAPGRSSFTLFSGSVTAPSLFIPGPIPGDPNTLVPGPTTNNIATGLEGSAKVGNQLQQTGRRSSSGQVNNKLSMSKQGQFTFGTSTLMTITRP
jgi:hypothetical protein